MTLRIVRFPMLVAAAALAAACGDTTSPYQRLGPPPVHSVEFPGHMTLVAEMTPVEGTERAWDFAMRFRNGADSPVTIRHGACSVAIWLYSASAPDSPPVWDNVGGCIDPLYEATVNGGTSYAIRAGRVDERVLALLAPGRYIVRLAIDADSYGIGTRSGIVVRTAGEIAVAP